jgi:hypothetical protein
MDVRMLGPNPSRLLAPEDVVSRGYASEFEEAPCVKACFQFQGIRTPGRFRCPAALGAFWS